MMAWAYDKKGSVTSPLGYLASGMYCGIKKRSRKHDASLLISEVPAVAAGTFTTSAIKAWPVLASMKAMKGAHHQAILMSSGNANCVNGARGKKAVAESISTLAGHLNLKEQEIFIAQTGLIGAPFPISCFKRAIPQLVKKLSKSGGHLAAKGIMTTDTCAKETAISSQIGGVTVTIGAMGKGSGMVHPNMATMLAFLTTDVAISKPLLKRATRYAVEDTFNKIAIDNDMSTNDSVFVMANGQAGNPTIQKIDKDYYHFREGLKQACKYLAYEMLKDGEGVTHICTLKVSGAKNPTQAEAVARHIANSMLFKTMMAGADPNWGRIVAAIGSSGASFKYDQLNISFDDVHVLHHGKVRVLNLPKARKVLQKKDYTIEIVLGKGRGKSEFMTTDLTKKYVEINSAYC